MKIKDFLTNLNYSILGFTAFAVRLAIYGASIGDAIALFAFAGLYGFHAWMKRTEVQRYNEKFENDVKIEFVKAAEEISKVKTAMGALNLGSTYRTSLKAAPNGPAPR